MDGMPDTLWRLFDGPKPLGPALGLLQLLEAKQVYHLGTGVRATAYLIYIPVRQQYVQPLPFSSFPPLLYKLEHACSYSHVYISSPSCSSRRSSRSNHSVCLSLFPLRVFSLGARLVEPLSTSSRLFPLLLRITILSSQRLFSYTSCMYGSPWIRWCTLELRIWGYSSESRYNICDVYNNVNLREPSIEARQNARLMGPDRSPPALTKVPRFR